MDNNTGPSQIDAICTAIERKFPMSRCWFEPFPGRIRVRYPGGASDYVTLLEALKLLTS